MLNPVPERSNLQGCHYSGPSLESLGPELSDKIQRVIKRCAEGTGFTTYRIEVRYEMDLPETLIKYPSGALFREIFFDGGPSFEYAVIYPAPEKSTVLVISSSLGLSIRDKLGWNATDRTRDILRILGGIELEELELIWNEFHPIRYFAQSSDNKIERTAGAGAH